MKAALQTSVAILALLVGSFFCFAAARGYMLHNTIVFRPLLIGLVDVVVACVLLLRAHHVAQSRNREADADIQHWPT